MKRTRRRSPISPVPFGFHRRKQKRCGPITPTKWFPGNWFSNGKPCRPLPRTHPPESRNMPLAKLLNGYLLLLLGSLIVAVIYTELRQRLFKTTPKQNQKKHNTNCGSVYTDDPDVDRSRCVH